MSRPSLADLLVRDPWGKPPTTPLAQNFLSKLIDEPIGAVERWGHRGAQMRQQGLDLINASMDPNVGQLQGLGMAALGAGMIPASPFLSLLPSSQELRDRGRAAGGGDFNQAIGGAIGDLVNIPDPATSATALATLGKAALTAKGLATAAPILGKSAAVAPLGKGLAELMAEASPAEQLALKARLEAEVGQTGGAASGISREQALTNLTEAALKNRIQTYHYKQPLEDGTLENIPGTHRVNKTPDRFNPEMTIADVKRYIEQYGGPPLPRVKGEVVTGKRKDVYPDGTVEPVPGLLRTKRPPLQAEAAQTGGVASGVSREQALQGLTGGNGDAFNVFHGSEDTSVSPIFKQRFSERGDVKPSFFAVEDGSGNGQNFAESFAAPNGKVFSGTIPKKDVLDARTEEGMNKLRDALDKYTQYDPDTWLAVNGGLRNGLPSWGNDQLYLALHKAGVKGVLLHERNGVQSIAMMDPSLFSVKK